MLWPLFCGMPKAKLYFEPHAREGLNAFLEKRLPDSTLWLLPGRRITYRESHNSPTLFCRWPSNTTALHFCQPTDSKGWRPIFPP
jgi:hypothetical protein